jgi:menaquinol-cytochrome c reductase iron-sulfur subunit
MMSDKMRFDRSDFMTVATLAIGGVIGFSLGIPAIRYIIGPAAKKTNQEEWIRLGSTAKVEIGTPTLFKATIQRQTGWIANEEELTVFVLTDNGRDYIALSNICTHLGCRVRWINEQGEFFCPCHNGIFNKDGEVVSGPPPKPLNQYQVKVENDQIFILGG